MISKNVKQKPRGMEIGVHHTENVKASPNGPKTGLQPKRFRLLRLTSTELGPDKDPVFYCHSALSEAKKDGRVKDYLFRQIEGHKPLGSSPLAPRCFIWRSPLVILLQLCLRTFPLQLQH